MRTTKTRSTRITAESFSNCSLWVWAITLRTISKMPHGPSPDGRFGSRCRSTRWDISRRNSNFWPTITMMDPKHSLGKPAILTARTSSTSLCNSRRPRDLSLVTYTTSLSKTSSRYRPGLRNHPKTPLRSTISPASLWIPRAICEPFSAPCSTLTFLKPRCI